MFHQFAFEYHVKAVICVDWSTNLGNLVKFPIFFPYSTFSKFLGQIYWIKQILYISDKFKPHGPYLGSPDPRSGQIRNLSTPNFLIFVWYSQSLGPDFISAVCFQYWRQCKNNWPIDPPICIWISCIKCNMDPWTHKFGEFGQVSNIFFFPQIFLKFWDTFSV